jgi:hypothetical protein
VLQVTAVAPGTRDDDADAPPPPAAAGGGGSGGGGGGGTDDTAAAPPQPAVPPRRVAFDMVGVAEALPPAASGALEPIGIPEEEARTTVTVESTVIIGDAPRRRTGDAGGGGGGGAIVAAAAAAPASSRWKCNACGAQVSATTLCYTSLHLFLFMFVWFATRDSLLLVDVCFRDRLQFATPDEHRSHSRGEWHRFNLKRKLAALPPMSEREFGILDADEREAFLKQLL